MWLHLKIQGWKDKKSSHEREPPIHFARCQSSPCPAGRAAGAAACTLSPSWRGTARDTQPRPSGEQCHTETQGQSAARDERLHSLLFFPAPFVKQALMAEL